MRKQSRIIPLSRNGLSDDVEYTTQINDFLGVDYSHSQLFVEDYRATDMRNLIKMNGFTQKRFGWKEIFSGKLYKRLETISNSIKINIDYVWKFEAKYGTYLVFVINTKLYCVALKSRSPKTYDYTYKDLFDLSVEESDNVMDTFEAITSEQGFANIGSVSYSCFQDGMMYVIGENQSGSSFIRVKEIQTTKAVDDGTFPYWTLQFEEVFDKYIPTIRQGGVFDEYNAGMPEDMQIPSQELEQFNLLASKVKCEYFGLNIDTFDSFVTKTNCGTYGGDDYSHIYSSYTLPSIPLVVSSNGVKTFGNVSLSFNARCYLNTSETTQTIDSDGNYKITTKFNCQEVSNYPNDGYHPVLLGSIARLNEEYDNDIRDKSGLPCCVIEYENELEQKFYITYESTGVMVKNKDGNAVDDYFTYDENGMPTGTVKIILNNFLIQDTNLFEPALYVEYERNIPEYKEKIFNCKIGMEYGYDNNQNQLFLSGNDNYRNCDFFSGKDRNGIYRYDYFPDLNYQYFGSDLTGIRGYGLGADGSMIIMKEPSSTEPTIYIREVEKDYYNESYYNVKTGNIGKGVVGYHNVLNLNGDSLIISDDGVYGIEIDKAVNTNQRFAMNRSRLVDTKFTKELLEKSVAYCFDNKLFLSLDNGLCYIADSRYKSQLPDDLTTNFQYEWWVWDNVNAKCFFNYNGKLYFVSKEGRVCGFTDNSFEDTTFNIHNHQAGELTYDNGYFSCSDAFDKDNLIQICYKTSLLNWKTEYARVDSVYYKDNDGIYYDKSKLVLFNVTDTDSNGNEVDVKKYYTVDEDGNKVKEVCNENQAFDYFKLSGLSDETYDILSVGTANYYIVEYISSPVVCKLITKTFDFGTNVYMKKLKGLYLTPDTIKHTKVEFGYETRKHSFIMFNNETLGDKEFNFKEDGGSFKEVSFSEELFAKSIPARYRDTFMYIRFMYGNSEPYACRISELTVIYSIGTKTKGVN